MPTYARDRKKKEARGNNWHPREEEPKEQMTLDDFGKDNTQQTKPADPLNRQSNSDVKQRNTTGSGLSGVDNAADALWG
jgi:hypothetical protein